jgi:hypothetical protein
MAILLDADKGINFPTWTTLTRPATPTVGQMGYNTTTGLFDQYTASGWVGSLNNASRSIPNSAVPAGSILQVVYGSLGTQITVTATTYANIGLSATITPTSSTSKVQVMCSMSLGISIANSGGGVLLARNGSTVFTPTQADGTGPYLMYSSASSNWVPGGFNYLDSPASASAVTYYVQARAYNATGGIFFNGVGGVATPGTCTLLLMEVAV